MAALKDKVVIRGSAPVLPEKKCTKPGCDGLMKHVYFDGEVKDEFTNNIRPGTEIKEACPLCLEKRGIIIKQKA
ncbi:MAG: hypothetical protein ACI88L_000135 [Candidatus Paceibacteria bacterium]|jgi:hypothetical protein